VGRSAIRPLSSPVAGVHERSSALMTVGVAALFGLGSGRRKCRRSYSPPRSPENANYEIAVELDASQHTLKGKEVIRGETHTGHSFGSGLSPLPERVRQQRIAFHEGVGRTPPGLQF